MQLTTDPSLLCHPNIPKPLHGIAPRVIYGLQWWDKERKKAYANADFCCQACGVPKKDAIIHQWLEAHETYDYDFPNGRLTFTGLVALCHACHNFIHSGRLEVLKDNGKITIETYVAINNHGMKVLKDANLVNKWKKRHIASEMAPWRDFRMVIGGKKYGPSSKSYDDWLNGAWKNWQP